MNTFPVFCSLAVMTSKHWCSSSPPNLHGLPFTPPLQLYLSLIQQAVQMCDAPTLMCDAPLQQNPWPCRKFEFGGTIQHPLYQVGWRGDMDRGWEGGKKKEYHQLSLITADGHHTGLFIPDLHWWAHLIGCNPGSGRSPSQVQPFCSPFHPQCLRRGWRYSNWWF